MLNPKLLSVVESIVGPEITVNPIQHVRPYLPLKEWNTQRNYSSEKEKEQQPTGLGSLARRLQRPVTLVIKFTNLPMHLTTKQDQGVTREEADASEILTTWTPLFDVAVAQGLLVFARMPDRTQGGSSSRSDGLRDYDRPIDNPKDAKGTHCDTKRGDVLFLHRFTPHRGTLNSSDYVDGPWISGFKN